ncbi:MAG: hydroxymethylbilane synthase [Amphiplicatus sp.]
MDPKPSFPIGTRASTMALAQTRAAADRLNAAFPGLGAAPAPFSTRGDRDQVSRLDRHGGKGGAFVEEIRAALRDGRIAAAMHSLKDMPGDEEAPGLVIGAALPREAPGDALALRPGLALDEFLARRGAGFVIGAGSVRRAAYLRRLYPGARIVHYRGAADTRLRKLDDGVPQKLPGGGETPPADALVLARAGLDRIGASERAAYDFPYSEMLPAIGQGVVALECRADAWATREKLARVDDASTRAAIEAEREVLWVLNGHCNAPIAGHARLAGETLHLKAAVLSEDGAALIEAEADGPAARPRAVGRAVGLALIEKGARALIDASRPA